MTSGIITLLFASFIGGGLTPFFIKLGIREIPPLTFTVFRFGIATLVFLPIYLKHNGVKINRKNFKWVFVDSLFFALNVGIFSIGLQFTNVVISQIMYAFSPVIIALLSHHFLGEKITLNKAIGSIIAFLGLLFLISQSFSDRIDFGNPLGNIFILLGVFCWACYITISRKISHSYSQISISFANFLVSTVLLAILMPFELSIRSFHFSDIQPLGYLSLAVVSLISSVIYINLLQIGIKKCGAFIASLFNYFGPFFASILAVPFLNEKITINLVLGGLLIIFGVFYATSYSRLLKLIKKSYN